jgi:hypothetical protein
MKLIVHVGVTVAAAALVVADATVVGFAGLSLGVQRVKGLFEALFRGFAGIDSTPDPGRCRHAFFSLVPKKAGPDHRVPVISRAIFDRLP